MQHNSFFQVLIPAQGWPIFENSLQNFILNLFLLRDHIDYIENQCSKPLPDCSYTVSSRDLTVIANDDILYSRTLQDCERFCDDVSRILKGIPPSLIFNISRPELSIVGVLLKKEIDVTWGKFSWYNVNPNTPLILLTLAVMTAQPFRTPLSLLRLEPSTGRKSAPEVSNQDECVLRCNIFYILFFKQTCFPVFIKLDIFIKILFPSPSLSFVIVKNCRIFSC